MYWVFCIFFVFGATFGKHEIYDGHLLYEVTSQNVEQTKLLHDLENQLYVDVWGHVIPGRAGEILVAREKKQKFEDALNAAGVEYKVKVDNIKELLDLEDQLLAEASSRRSNNSRVTGLPFDTIHTYDEVDAYLEQLAAAYPDVVTLVNAGNSFEGRPIKYLKISSTNFEDPNKPVVFMESLLHAREWVTLPATLYAIEMLVIQRPEADRDLLRDIDWIILPIVNPDGFEFTRENRFWRKNRATGYMVGNVCMGVDLNRNFDVNWSQHSSNVVCTETFHGGAPFSEPESAIVADIVRKHSERMELFLDIHSFGSMVLYGYGTGQLPANGLFLHLVGIQMAVAIDNVKMAFNPNYIVGNTAAVLYFVSGSSTDYAQQIGIPFSYTYELPGHRLGLGTVAGFLVDPDFIEQAGFETWEGIKVGARYVRDNFRRQRGLLNEN